RRRAALLPAHGGRAPGARAAERPATNGRGLSVAADRVPRAGGRAGRRSADREAGVHVGECRGSGERSAVLRAVGAERPGHGRMTAEERASCSHRRGRARDGTGFSDVRVTSSGPVPSGCRRRRHRDGSSPIAPALGAAHIRMVPNTRKLTYTVVLEEDPPRYWHAYAPAVPGCFAGGRTRGEALRRYRAALRLHLGELAGRGRSLPIERRSPAVQVVVAA